MAFAMASVEWTPPFPSSTQNHQISTKVSKHRHWVLMAFKHVDDSGLIHAATSTAATAIKQTIQKRSEESPIDIINNPYTKNSNAYASILHACTNIKQLKQFHAHMLRNGCEENISLVTKVVSLYAMFSDVNSARLVFEKIYRRDSFLWNVMIRGCANNGQGEEALTFYYQMLQAGVRPDKFTYPFLLTACATLLALEEGKEIHAHIIKTGFESDVFVGNSLVALYAKCQSIDIARHLFDGMSHRSVVSWNAMIAGYAQSGHADEALTLYHEMQLAGMTANSVTVVSVLQACAHLADLPQGKGTHGYIIRSGIELNIFVENALIDMYAKCGKVEIARQLFDKMPTRDVVSWNAMVAGYAQGEHSNEALTLFNEMEMSNVTPSAITMVSALQACADLAVLEEGKRIHDYITRCGFESNVVVGTALINMYAKCGSADVARHMFDKMCKRDVISWSAMIDGYAHNGHANEALALFHEMQLAKVAPCTVTLASVLQACAHLASLQQGRGIHGYIFRSGFESDVSVGNSLITLYAKCGRINVARNLFDTMTKRNVASWSAMIGAYGLHGCDEDALALFSQMQQTGIKPNYITFVCVLSACSHAGLVDEGWDYLDCMIRDYGIVPRVEHYACMVDLLGRAGHLEEAQHLVNKMPLEPDAGVWGSLLGACRIHCNIELGEHVAERLFDLEPQNFGWYVLLSNLYAVAGRWDGVAKVRKMVRDRGVKKTPECSLIEVNNRVHSFLVGDKSHPQSEEIYAMLKTLSEPMKEAGYVPNTDFVLYNVEEEVKEHMLGTHSEKLAIAFGLINTSPGTPILITKNLCVCGDCHNATKLISKIVRREIMVRDVNRFHHFKDGLCSCQFMVPFPVYSMFGNAECNKLCTCMLIFQDDCIWSLERAGARLCLHISDENVSKMMAVCQI
eukprot:Gb_36085 [translate_table: standard]